MADEGRTTVLVVDDAAASRYAMGAVLRRAGHSVVPVASAGEALAELDERHRSGALPDLALVDVGLPDMSGFELCRRLKAQPPTAALPVVHFSAAAIAPGDRCQGLDAGGEAYLTVPAEPEEIQAVVRAAVRGARMRNGAEALVRRLTLLSETIVDVQAARTLGELATAAAEGAARLTRSPAAVFVLGEDGELYSGTSHARARTTLPDAGAHDTVGRLIRRLTAADPRAHDTVVPAPLWPAGFFRPGVCEDARLVLARTEGGTPICVALPLSGTHATPTDTTGLVSRLAQATALAAQPLLMYQVERHVALTLQHSFLPKRVPEFPGLEVVVRYVPASRQTEIGGDFYAAVSTRGGILTAVGDVVGHSLEAATVMVEIRHALRAFAVEEADPGVLAARLDQMLQHYHPDVTATVCLALVEPRSGRVRVANAGHIPPLVVHEAGDAEYMKASGPLLGLGLDRPEPTETTLWPTDRLLMVTDGLIETRGIDLSVSMEHLRTAAADAPLGTVALCDTLLHCFGRDRDDDIAMLALRLRLG
ncbi:fused response regulator/phosphatase [Streptomyces neyagawaensis]|uniref:fused response regulator/phosphatase n=2 Tax=Streptomyces neyagawaensis TaxID=42238 RepID=UPI00201CD61A|nr:fused response regulator/phosphatase [Streptomyces neyagawaensis]MCL6732618.1 fused response regulator/phosphatase [Streptomyces neyagawaensis]MDE1681612.1 fused response regulator/phosphatase [Streptomyces neyagawaensis]